MSNPYQNSPKTGQGCLKALGIGCGSIVALTMLSSAVAITGSIGSTIAVVLLIGVSVFFGIRQNRKNEAKSSEEFLPSASQPLAAEVVQNHKAKDNSDTEVLKFANPLCEHTFIREQLYANSHISCECGNTFSVKDLFEFERLTLLAASTKAELANLKASMRANSSSSSGKRVTKVLETAAASESTTRIKPKIEKPARPKVNLSLQQWLIIGASVLVVVAGSVFVSTNVNRLDQWVFQLITVSVAAATGFGAFKARSISVLLANFLAAFSASMQLATMSIIGDQISPDFEWNTMPAWWWCVSLIVVSALSTVLAKFSKNFGFKGIAILGSASASLVLIIGVLADQIQRSWAPLSFGLAAALGAIVLAQNRFLRGIEQAEVADKAARAWAKDIADREDVSLRILASIVAALVLLGGIGSMFNSINVDLFGAISWVALISVAAIWAALILLSRFWIDQTENPVVSEKNVLNVSRGVVVTSIALAAVFAATEIVQVQPESVGAATAAAASAIATLAALVWFAPKAKSLAPNRVSIVVALWSSLAVWVFWSQINLLTSPMSWLTGAYGIAFAVVLSLSDLRYNVNRYDWGSLVVNGFGVVLIALTLTREIQFAFDSIELAVVSLLLVVATTLQMPIRYFVNEKQGFHPAALTKWVAFFFGAVVSVIMFVESAGNGQVVVGVPVAFAIAFMIFTIASQTLALWGPSAKNYSTYLSANHYLGQAIVLLVVANSFVSAASTFAGTNSLLIAALAVINYAFGTLKRQQLKMQTGYAAAILAFLTWQWSISEAELISTLLLQVSVIAAATWLHTWFLRKRTEVAEATLVATPIAGIGLSSLFGWLVLLQVTTIDNPQVWLQAMGIYSALALATGVFGKFGPLTKIKTRQFALGWVAIEYAFVGVLLSQVRFSDLVDVESFGPDKRALLAFVVLSISLWLKNFKINHFSVGVGYYLSNLAAAWYIGNLITGALARFNIPESRSIWFALALVVSALTSKVATGAFRQVALLDVPILGTALWSFIYAISNFNASDLNTWRGIVSLAAIATYAFVKSAKEPKAPWLIVGYVSSLGSSLWLANGISSWLSFDFDGPEFYSVLASISIAISNRVLVKRLANKFGEVRLILLVATLILPSIVHALGFDMRLVENEIRLATGLLVAAAFSIWRISRSKPMPWIISAYVSSVSAGLALGLLVCDQFLPSFNGPEVYGLLAAAAIMAVHRAGRNHLVFKTSLIKLGLPLAVVLVPSTLFTYTSLEIPFEQLPADQLARIVIVLLISAGLLIHGSRAGNLATSAIGLVGLALLVIPNTAMHSDSVVEGSQIDSTALVVAALVFTALSLARRYANLSGNSLLFTGLPIAIALAPALVQSLAALGNPSLATIDWWRFAIVLTAGMTLLITGTLREVAGLFYPGLLSVLLSALPYGFKQNEQNQWSLWVLLLLVAGVMVWLAVRLERLKKAGRNSATWLKELK
jgi:hypothetical protein